MKLRYYLIKVEFLFCERNFRKATQVLGEIKAISKMIRHKYFYDKALEFDNKIINEVF